MFISGDNIYAGGESHTASDRGYCQAGGLACSFCFFLVILPIIFALKSILNKYPDKSFTMILEVIFGRFIGKIVTFAYILFFIILLDTNVSGISNKLGASLYPDVHPALFILVLLAVIGFAVYKGGLTVITRMGELALPLLVLVFVLLCALTSQNIKLSRLTPISALDIIPVLKSSLTVSAVQAHLPMCFCSAILLTIKIKWKLCTSAALMYMLLLIVLLVTVVGSLGAETVENTPLSFMATFKLISLFESIERIDPFVVGLWIITDFMIISVLLITLLNMYRSLFVLSKTRNFIIISLIIIFLTAMMLSRICLRSRVFLKYSFIPR